MRKLRIPESLDILKLASEPQYLVYGRRRIKHKQVWVQAWFKTHKLIKHIDYCYALVDTIIRVNEKDQEGDQSLFTNLKKEYLLDSIPESTFDTCLSFLKALAVVETDGEYVPAFMAKKGQKPKSYGYRLTEAFRGDVMIVAASSRVSIKKRKSAKKRTEKALKDHNKPAYGYQVQQLLGNTYSVDNKQSIFEYIRQLQGTRDRKGKVITSTAVTRMIQEIDDISVGSIEGVTIDVYGRFHSVVNRLTRELRGFITGIDGKSLIQLDFQSSYTFHLIKLICEKKGMYVFNNNYNTIPHNAPTLFEKELQFLYKTSKEQDLYSYIAHQYKTRYSNLSHDPDIERQLVKDTWNRSFLNTQSGKPVLAQFIRTLFPEVNQFIEEYGRHRLWQALMRSEAELVHHRIIARIAREIGSDCSLFSIHDAILTDRHHSRQVLEIMAEESESYFGFKAKIKSEVLINPLNTVQSITVSDMALEDKYS